MLPEKFPTQTLPGPSIAIPAGPLKAAAGGLVLLMFLRNAPAEFNSVTLPPVMFVIHTFPEASIATPTGSLKLAPAGGKIPIRAPFSASSVALPPPLTIHLSPSASIAIASGRVQFAPRVLLLCEAELLPAG